MILRSTPAPRLSTLAMLAMLALATACNSDAGVDVIYPGCFSPKEVAIEGNIDGQTVRIRQSWETLTFVNADPATAQLGTLDIGLSPDPAGDRVHIEFAGDLQPGGTVSSRGYALLTAGGGPTVGNCETGSFGGLISLDIDTTKGTFLIGQLRHDPYCSGPVLSGDLRGCFALPPPADAGVADAGAADGGVADAGVADAGLVDAL